jgi:beta-glucosidase-like glycosyl hydrolase
MRIEELTPQTRREFLGTGRKVLIGALIAASGATIFDLKNIRNTLDQVDVQVKRQHPEPSKEQVDQANRTVGELNQRITTAANRRDYSIVNQITAAGSPEQQAATKAIGVLQQEAVYTDAINRAQATSYGPLGNLRPIGDLVVAFAGLWGSGLIVFDAWTKRAARNRQKNVS